MTKRTNEGTWATVNRLSVELCIEHHDRLADLILFLHAHRDSFASVQHCSVIPTPEGVSNFMQGGFSVAPRVEKGAYKITFSELGRPHAYSGQTELTIREQDRRVLMLPAIDLGLNGMLETVVLIQKTKNKDDGETSRFEIN